jgi:hypothetical protein
MSFRKGMEMKRVELCYSLDAFNELINRTDIEVLQIDVKVVEKSYYFQEGFCGVVFYKELIGI